MENTLVVKNKKSCDISNVEEIISSSNKEIVLMLKDSSFLMIKGKELKINSFNNTNIQISGNMSSFTYSD